MVSKQVGLRRQFTLGMIAQVFSQCVSIVAQLAVLPIVVVLWGVEKYGAWLILSAVPAYLSLADFGFAQISANDMTMKMSRGDVDGARVVSDTAWLMNGCVCLGVLATTTIFIIMVPVGDILNIPQTQAENISATIFMLSLTVVVQLVFGVIGAAMRAVGLFWVIIGSNAAARLSDAVLLIVSASLGWNLASAASIMLVGRFLIVLLVSKVFYLRNKSFRPSISRADIGLLKRMIFPSLAYMTYVLSNSINIQGVTIVVGSVLGPTAVVVVTAVRTFTRLGRMAASIVIYAMEPVFAQLLGRGDAIAGRKAFLALVFCTTVGSALYVFGMMIFGEIFLKWWTHGTVVDQKLLFYSMLLAIIFEIFWFTLQTPFVSTNRHSMFAIWLLIFSVLGVAILYPMLVAFGIVAAGWVTAAIHGLTLVATLILSRRANSFTGKANAPHTNS